MMENRVEQIAARILVAEDDPELRLVLEEGLRSRQYEVHSVENGDDLERELRSGDYQLVISDIVMQGKSCQEVYRDNLKSGRRIPFVMISGHVPPRDCPVSLGGEQYQLYLLSKPFTLKALAELVERALS